MSFSSNGLGDGSTFYFELPLYDSEAATSDTGLDTESIPESTLTTKKYSTSSPFLVPGRHFNSVLGSTHSIQLGITFCFYLLIVI